ncbi:MAG: hypothetical protein Q8K60_01985 [Parachlamydiaceae bacterium]|nr:hypothetical protein [Parachlamydiaceae bacterium]
MSSINNIDPFDDFVLVEKNNGPSEQLKQNSNKISSTLAKEGKNWNEAGLKEKLEANKKILSILQNSFEQLDTDTIEFTKKTLKNEIKAIKEHLEFIEKKLDKGLSKSGRGAAFGFRLDKETFNNLEKTKKNLESIKNVINTSLSFAKADPNVVKSFINKEQALKQEREHLLQIQRQQEELLSKHQKNADELKQQKEELLQQKNEELLRLQRQQEELLTKNQSNEDELNIKKEELNTIQQELDKLRETISVKEKVKDFADKPVMGGAIIVEEIEEGSPRAGASEGFIPPPISGGPPPPPPPPMGNIPKPKYVEKKLAYKKQDPNDPNKFTFKTEPNPPDDKYINPSKNGINFEEGRKVIQKYVKALELCLNPIKTTIEKLELLTEEVKQFTIQLKQAQEDQIALQKNIEILKSDEPVSFLLKINKKTQAITKEPFVTDEEFNRINSIALKAKKPPVLVEGHKKSNALLVIQREFDENKRNIEGLKNTLATKEEELEKVKQTPDSGEVSLNEFKEYIGKKSTKLSKWKNVLEQKYSTEAKKAPEAKKDELNQISDEKIIIEESNSELQEYENLFKNNPALMALNEIPQSDMVAYKSSIQKIGELGNLIARNSENKNDEIINITQNNLGSFFSLRKAE